MLPTHLTNLITELQNGHDISAKLKETFNLPSEKLTRTHRLKLANRILEIGADNSSEHVHWAFREAILAMRELVPFLKKGNSPLSNTIAAVEKYCVNHASCVLFDGGEKQATLRSSIAQLTEESLRRVCEARKTPPKRARRPAQACEISPNSAAKENREPCPSGILATDEAFDTVAFRGAAKAGVQAFLPRNDSGCVVVVVSGTLVARLSMAARVACVSPLELMTMTKQLVMPWLDCLASFVNGSEQHFRPNYLSYVKRVQHVLLKTVREPNVDDVSALRVRAYALTLGDIKLKQYARDVLTIAQSVTRLKSDTLPHSVKFNIVAELYDDALHFCSKFELTDMHWYSENASTWLDHVLYVWCRRPTPSAIPNIFAKRISALKKLQDEPGILGPCELQRALIKAGVYHACAGDSSDVSFDDATSELIGKEVAKLAINASSTWNFNRGDTCDENGEVWKNEARALNRLRVLRVLEPIRVFLYAANPGSKSKYTEGEVAVFEMYINALLDGVQIVYRLPLDDEKSVAGGVMSRLRKIIPAALEAAKEVIRFHLRKGAREALKDVLESTRLLFVVASDTSEKSAEQWKRGMCSFAFSALSSLCKSGCSNASKIREQRNFIAEVSDDLVTMWFHSLSDKSSFLPEICALWGLARNCYAATKDWSSAVLYSSKSYCLQSLRQSCETLDCASSSLQKDADCFVRDICLAIDSTESLGFVEELPNPNTLLCAVTDFCIRMQQRHRDLRSRKNSSREVFTLRRVRKHLLEMFVEVDGTSCLQRTFHLCWVSLFHAKLPEHDILLRMSNLFSAFDCSKCAGHNASHEKHIARCSSTHYSFLEILSMSVWSVNESNFAGLKDLLVSASSMLASNDMMQNDKELMCFSFEILEWIGTVSATENATQASLAAFNTATVCREHAGVPGSSVPLHFLLEYINIVSWRLDISRWPTFVLSFHHNTERDESELMDPSNKGQTEDLISAMKRESLNLKSVLMPLMSLKSDEPPASDLYHVAGVCVHLHSDIHTEAGQIKFYDVLLLLEALLRYGHILLLAENIADGRYYLERCSHLASLCLPPSNSFYRLVNSLQLLQNPDFEREDAIASLLDGDYIIEDGKSVCSQLSYWQGISLAALMSYSGQLRCRIAADIGHDLLAICRKVEMIANNVNLAFDEFLPSPSASEILVWKGVTMALTGNPAETLETLRAAFVDDKSNFRGAKVVAHLFLARALIHNSGGLETFLNLKKVGEIDSKNRITYSTRSQARRKATEQFSVAHDSSRVAVYNQIEQALHEIFTDQSCPQMSRQVWCLKGVVSVTSKDATAAFAKSIGLTFDIRWNLSRSEKSARLDILRQNKTELEDVQDAMQKVDISAGDSQKSSLPFCELIERLSQQKCVVVGLSLDEDMSCLVLWRISPNGLTTKRIPLPNSGESSFVSITNRIETVIAELKAKAVRAGQSMTLEEKQDWWEHRHALDAAVEKILSDIESDWFGSGRFLMVPSIFDECVTAEHSSLSGEIQSDALEQLLVGAYSEVFEVFQGDEDVVDLTGVDCTTGELILVMDTALECIPWESMSILRKLCVGVTRAPSLSFVDYGLQATAKAIPSRSVFYVVNPGGDLQRTEDKFKSFLQSQPWNGLIGNSSKEAASAEYGNERIYLYCGHGAGDQYLSPRRFSKRGEAPVALLMGCSSVRPINSELEGCESNSAAIDYLTQGSRAVLGNLWDVGDKDIDRFTSSVLLHWLGVSPDSDHFNKKMQRLSLAGAVAASRSACRLPFLVGAAAVVMGSPNIWTEDGRSKTSSRRGGGRR